MKKTFSIRTDIVFGPGAMNALDAVREKPVLLVTDSFLSRSPMAEQVMAHLENCRVTLFDRVVPDPPVEVVAAGVEALRASRAAALVALGGGSSLDTAKAIRAVAARMDGFDGGAMPLYAIPTTSGSGSEVTDAAVITHRAEGVKYPLLGAELRPDVAILDPALVMTVPPHVTADTGMDALAHAIEAYVAKDANDFTDALAEKAAALVLENLPAAYGDGANASARERLHNASCLAGLAFNTAGLGLVHGMAHALGGRFHVAHGRLNAVLLPAVIRFNAGLDGRPHGPEAEAAAEKYRRLARVLGMPADAPQVGTHHLIRTIQRLNRTLGIPASLKGLGIEKAELLAAGRDIAENARNDATTAWNPRPVSEQDVLRILQRVTG